VAGLAYLRKPACVNRRAGALNPPPRANARGHRGKIVEKATGISLLSTAIDCNRLLSTAHGAERRERTLGVAGRVAREGAVPPAPL